ncbi:MAG TPA: hypothetical protein VK824_07605 [Planctomycetota bacterium]|nr:hypothetical protein [Planctomycetota bacterium]
MTATLNAQLGGRAVRVLDALSVAVMLASLGIAALQVRHVDAGWLTSHGADALCPAFMWWTLRRTAFAKRRHAAAEAAGLILAGCWGWELCQLLDPRGDVLPMTAGVFDPVDLAVYAAVLLACWLLDEALQRRQRRIRTCPGPPPLGSPPG